MLQSHVCVNEPCGQCSSCPLPRVPSAPFAKKVMRGGKVPVLSCGSGLPWGGVPRQHHLEPVSPHISLRRDGGEPLHARRYLKNFSTWTDCFSSVTVRPWLPPTSVERQISPQLAFKTDFDVNELYKFNPALIPVALGKSFVSHHMTCARLGQFPF